MIALLVFHTAMSCDSYEKNKSDLRQTIKSLAFSLYSICDLSRY